MLIHFTKFKFNIKNVTMRNFLSKVLLSNITNFKNYYFNMYSNLIDRNQYY